MRGDAIDEFIGGGGDFGILGFRSDLQHIHAATPGRLQAGLGGIPLLKIVGGKTLHQLVEVGRGIASLGIGLQLIHRHLHALHAPIGVGVHHVQQIAVGAVAAAAADEREEHHQYAERTGIHEISLGYEFRRRRPGSSRGPECLISAWHRRPIRNRVGHRLRWLHALDRNLHGRRRVILLCEHLQERTCPAHAAEQGLQQ